ncbi:MAG: DinB family protein [Actinopolymorphaceae bacterium]
MTTDAHSTHELLERIELSWQAFRPLVDKLTPDQVAAPRSDGRTVLEALAAVAFWNETCTPVFAWMRDQPDVPAPEWYGGDDLAIAAGAPWPRDDVHHAREAAWARAVPVARVLARLDDAHAAAVAVIGTLTPAELARGEGLGGPGDATGIPADHPWQAMTRAERLIAKATGCTYRLYDELRPEIERILATTPAS